MYQVFKISLLSILSLFLLKPAVSLAEERLHVRISELKENEILQDIFEKFGSPDKPNHNVDSLDLNRVRIDDTDIAYISDAFPSLTELHIHNSEGGDDVMKQLPTLKSLEQLSLGNLSKLTDTGMAYIPFCEKLWRLIFWSHSGVSEKGIESLASSSQLTSLGVSIGDSSLKIISRMKNIRSLTLFGHENTDMAMSYIWTMNLSSLTLESMKITDSGIKFIENTGTLIYLNLSELKISDQALFHVAKLKSLRSLWLRRTEVGDLGLSYLENHPTLRRINLNETKITSLSLKSLATLPKLVFLDIADAPGVNDQGIDDILRMRALERISMRNSGISSEGRKKIKLYRPDVDFL